MTALLVRPIVMSVYEVSGHRVPMPERMARATPDMVKSIYGIRTAVQKLGGTFALSDLFRSYDMQFQANIDFSSGKKKAYSADAADMDWESCRNQICEHSRLYG